MEQRYITRFRLPERGYVNTAPVVLAAGALSLDTKLPRLVVQLKFKNISPHRISALQVMIRGLGADGAETETVQFRYDALNVQRGQTFGTYTAIVLPSTEANSFTVTLESVSYQDGARWDAGGEWTYLPPFSPIDETLTDPELLQRCRKKLPFAKYGYAAPADLWYCACGGVNRDGEERCHRCARPRSLIAQYADLEGLTALRQGELAAQEARRTREEAARLEAKAKADALGAAAKKVEELKQSVLNKPEPSETQGKATGKKRKWLILAGVGVALVAVIAVLWQPGEEVAGEVSTPPAVEADAPNGETPAPVPDPTPPVKTPKPEEKPKPSHEIQVSTPTDTGHFTLQLREDSQGQCDVTKEMLRGLFPEMRYMEFEGVPNLGSDLDEYLANTYHMSRLVGSGGREGSDDTYGTYSARNDPDSPRYLLVFSDLTTLCGYAVGVPEQAGEGVWQLKVTRCDYDFTQLYQQKAQAFAAAEMPPYILNEDLETCGAKYFLYAFHLRLDGEQYQNTQLYYLWNQAASPYAERHLRDISTWSKRLPRDGCWQYYYLFDENRDLIGYTKLFGGN